MAGFDNVAIILSSCSDHIYTRTIWTVCTKKFRHHQFEMSWSSKTPKTIIFLYNFGNRFNSIHVYFSQLPLLFFFFKPINWQWFLWRNCFRFHMYETRKTNTHTHNRHILKALNPFRMSVCVGVCMCVCP